MRRNKPREPLPLNNVKAETLQLVEDWYNAMLQSAYQKTLYQKSRVELQNLDKKLEKALAFEEGENFLVIRKLMETCICKYTIFRSSKRKQGVKLFVDVDYISVSPEERFLLVMTEMFRKTEQESKNSIDSKNEGFEAAP